MKPAWGSRGIDLWVEERDLGEMDRSLEGQWDEGEGASGGSSPAQLPALAVVGEHHSLGMGSAENLAVRGEYDLALLPYDGLEVPRDIPGHIWEVCCSAVSGPGTDSRPGQLAHHQS